MIGITTLEGSIRISPTGNVGIDETETLQKALEEAFGAGGGVEVDLSACRSLSSSAIGALIACHNSLRSRGTRLKVSGATEDMRKLLRMMGLDRHFELA
ncbi:MAG: STAS domain-containing protein [Fibrobacteres bacterium]|jgi:anti-sigma B factor antagonist|nr:STAS domain-containing protein [Fibrobacterota bacterium]